jgi:predicted AlkP superfamily pyrophosphatase or phosphodiesterase
MSSRRKLLVVDVAALGADLAAKPGWSERGFTFGELEPAFPAVTCTAQATFRTGLPPRDHGMVANGLYFRNLRKVMFWEQSAMLVEGPRIWRAFRERGGRVGMMFWQQSLGEEVDLVLSPKPIHKHSGGMVQDCYSQPPELYDWLRGRIGRAFNLMHYWGPLASRKSSDWIVAATEALLETPGRAPDLLLTYLPHLDYDLQRCGPDSANAGRALAVIRDHLNRLRAAATAHGYEWLFFGDYAMGPTTGSPIYPNRILREAGLFRTRPVHGRHYPDFFSAHAFAMVDHEIAHVYADDDALQEQAAALFRTTPGIAEVLEPKDQHRYGIDHPRSGRLVLLADAGRWFAYPWWTDPAHAPDYATHVDIHNKPGYDPCELFFGWPPGSVSRNPERVRGTHGRTGPGRAIAWCSSCAFPNEPRTLVELSNAVKQWLTE